MRQRKRAIQTKTVQNGKIKQKGKRPSSRRDPREDEGRIKEALGSSRRDVCSRGSATVRSGARVGHKEDTFSRVSDLLWFSTSDRRKRKEVEKVSWNLSEEKTSDLLALQILIQNPKPGCLMRCQKGTSRCASRGTCV